MLYSSSFTSHHNNAQCNIVLIPESISWIAQSSMFSVGVIAYTIDVECWLILKVNFSNFQRCNFSILYEIVGLFHWHWQMFFKQNYLHCDWNDDENASAALHRPCRKHVIGWLELGQCNSVIKKHVADIKVVPAILRLRTRTTSPPYMCCPPDAALKTRS